MTSPSTHGDHGQGRESESDDEVQEHRRSRDLEREERRSLYDQTRQHTRGGGQAHAGLERQRASDDQSLAAERALVDHQLDSQRKRAEVEADRQAHSLSEAEDRLDEFHDAHDAEALERRQGLRVACAEFKQLNGALTVVQREVDPSQGEVVAQVNLALAAARRLRRALEGALDNEDMRGEHHDLGGSG